MSRWTPCKRSDFIRKLRRLGFDEPFAGSRHQFMVFTQSRMADSYQCRIFSSSTAHDAPGS